MIRYELLILYVRSGKNSDFFQIVPFNEKDSLFSC